MVSVRGCSRGLPPYPATSPVLANLLWQYFKEVGDKVNKKIYIILTFAAIGFLALLVGIVYTPIKESNGKLVSMEMTENIWTENKSLDIARKNKEQDLPEQEQAPENSILDSEDQELTEEINEQNLAALEWGDESPFHAYESYWVFPFEEMEYADDKEFRELREIFSEIQFYGGFPLGDEEKYKICKDKYAQLLKNEITVTVPETGEECYLEKFDLVIDKHEEKPYDLERYYFYLFDMDGNNAPELCLFERLGTGTKRFTCIFKYDFNLDKIVLWDNFSSSYNLLFGMNRIAGEGSNMDGFIFWLVDENAKKIFRIGFAWEGAITNGNVVYMAMLPQYINNANRDERVEQMKKKAFYERQTGKYYLRITEEQYEELSSHYFDAREKAAEELDKLEKNYSELFG